MNNKLSFNHWCDKNEEELIIAFAETGMDRELDFNIENALEEEYIKYMNSTPPRAASAESL